MNIDDAIKSHKQWKLMVESLFRGDREFEVNPSILIKDNLCKLGQWIYSQGPNKHSNQTQFEQLKDDHKKFHFLAGSILSLFKENKTKEAAEKLDEFELVSNSVIKLLEDLK